jgi:hypothetical protein
MSSAKSLQPRDPIDQSASKVELKSKPKHLLKPTPDLRSGLELRSKATPELDLEGGSVPRQKSKAESASDQKREPAQSGLVTLYDGSEEHGFNSKEIVEYVSIHHAGNAN